jgi:hypothetical protein
MKKNVGNSDKLIRLSVAVVLVLLYLTDVVSGITGLIFLGLAGVLAITGTVGFCPLYGILGMNTCKTGK